jgi:hypothetical protein
MRWHFGKGSKKNAAAESRNPRSINRQAFTLRAVESLGSARAELIE